MTASREFGILDQRTGARHSGNIACHICHLNERAGRAVVETDHREVDMRTLIISALAAAAVGGAFLAAAPAQAQEYPWCAQSGGRHGGGGRNCGFATYEQCMAARSGMGGFCERNLFYRGPAGAYAEQRRIRRHRRHHD